MSLIELFVVLAVIAILIAFVAPNYSRFLIEKRRVDAHQLLMENASRLQRCLTLAGAYDSGCNLTTTSQDGYYTLSSTLTGQTWTLSADPVGGKSQSGDSQCKSITLDHTGLRNASGTDPALCW
jgi:type IV pilus assembly protein PilE